MTTSNFDPVSTMAELETLSDDEMLDGYRSARIGDPEPGANLGKAYWHGWCNRMRDMGVYPSTEASRQLCREYLAEHRRQRMN